MPPFCLGETCHYFNQCDLFRSFHDIVEVQFGGLARLDKAVNNYKDNLNLLYRHPDVMLTVDGVLRNVIVSTYLHYIDTWAMNGACLGHHAVLMQSMLKSAMHFGHHRCREWHNPKECRRKGTPLSMPSPAINIDTLLTDEEENLKSVPLIPESWTCWVTQAIHCMLNPTAWPNISMPWCLVPVL